MKAALADRLLVANQWSLDGPTTPQQGLGRGWVGACSPLRPVIFTNRCVFYLINEVYLREITPDLSRTTKKLRQPYSRSDGLPQVY
jgi:hypothetical protein